MSFSLNVEMMEDAARLKPTDDFVAFSSIEMAKLTIEHHPGRMINGELMHVVGGPIDAVRRRRNGGIDWIAKKSYCPAN